MTPIERIQTIYAAFGRGDVPAILASLSEDVQWEPGTPANPIPWLQPLRGRANVVKFFEGLATTEITKFEPRHFFAAGNLVIDVCTIEYTVKSTGRVVVEDAQIHVWEIDDAGLVRRFSHRTDAMKVLQAMGHPMFA